MTIRARGERGGGDDTHRHDHTDTDAASLVLERRRAAHDGPQRNLAPRLTRGRRVRVAERRRNRRTPRGPRERRRPPPSPRQLSVRYLDFAGACRAVAEARDEAAAIGEPSLAPSCPLEDCPDRHTIESALASPRASFGGVEQYPTLAGKSAALTYSLAKSQACPDGNKRIALILLRAFLHVNGMTLNAPNEDIAGMILDAAASDRSEHHAMIQKLFDWLDTVIAPEEAR